MKNTFVYWINRLGKRLAVLFFPDLRQNCSKCSDSRVFIIWDDKGAGRCVGVFTSEKRANRIATVNPGYYRIHSLKLDEINPEAKVWLEKEQESLLNGLDQD